VDASVDEHQVGRASVCGKSDPWSLRGDKVAGKLTDPAQVKAKVKVAAKQVNQTATAVMAELVKRHITT